MKSLLKLLLILFFTIQLSGCINLVAVNELNNSAEEFMNTDDVDSAISRLESAIELDPCNFKTQSLLLEAYLIKKRCEDALPYAISIMNMDKKEAASYMKAAETYECLATKIYDTELTQRNKLDDKVIEEVYNKKAGNKYIFNLEKENEALSTYYDLMPNAEDINNVLDKIKNNKEKISLYKSKYDKQ